MSILTETADIYRPANRATVMFDEQLIFNMGGKLTFVSGLDKLVQTLRLELSIHFDPETQRGNKVFDTLQNADAMGSNYQLNKIRNDFLDALGRVQRNQSPRTPLSEQLRTIDDVTATFDEDDPTSIQVKMRVTNGSQQSRAVALSLDTMNFSISLIG